MKSLSICILGGTGFVGRHLAAELVKRGHAVKILSRRRERHRDLLVLPSLQIIQADVHDQAQLRTYFKDCDAVINLVGLFNEKGRSGKGFRAVHLELSRKIITMAIDSEVSRLLHMSALNASASEKSFYLRSKGEAESYVHTFTQNKIAVTSFRPSIIFGPGDHFLTRFAAILKCIPWIFPLACGYTKFSPVYVGDVVDIMIDALDNPDTFGGRINLCGPRQYTLQQLVEYIAATSGYRKKVVALPNLLARIQARILEFAPGKPFSIDNYYSLQKDSICPDANHCDTSLEVIAPGVLGKSVKR